MKTEQDGVTSPQDRAQRVAELAQQAFWQVVANEYPEISTGDFGPGETFAFESACLQAVRSWVGGNQEEGNRVMPGEAVPHGVWTPWGQVLCQNCHDAAPASRKLDWSKCTPETRTYSAYCNTCDVRVRLADEDVALLSRIRREVGGELQQTGGMCAALVIERADGCKIVVASVDDIQVARYAPGAWEAGGEDTLELRDLDVEATDSQVIAAVRGMKEGK